MSPDDVADELPPVAPCPEWCREEFHPWEPDGDEFMRVHRSIAPAAAGSTESVELLAVDHWSTRDGLTCLPPTIVFDGHPFSLDAVSEAIRLLRGAVR